MREWRFVAQAPESETIVDLRAFSLGVPISAMSGGRGGPADLLKDARLLGATTTLEKPFSSRAMLALIGRTLCECFQGLIAVSAGALNRIPCFVAEGSEFFEAVCQLDLDGIVAKRRADSCGAETVSHKIKT
jgi:hypothetical protein